MQAGLCVAVFVDICRGIIIARAMMIWVLNFGRIAGMIMCTLRWIEPHRKYTRKKPGALHICSGNCNVRIKTPYQSQ